MLKTYAVSAFALVVFSGTAAAEPIRSPGRFGLGIGMGTLANGLSAKWFMGREHALQFTLGEFAGGGFDNRWGHVGGFGFGVDYLFEMPAIAKAREAFELAWNIGAGLGIGFDDHDYHHGSHHHHDYVAFGASFVLGLEFNFIPVPIDLVIEFRPGLLLVPDVDFDPIDFTAHLRVYF